MKLAWWRAIAIAVAAIMLAAIASNYLQRMLLASSDLPDAPREAALADLHSPKPDRLVERDNQNFDAAVALAKRVELDLSVHSKARMADKSACKQALSDKSDDRIRQKCLTLANQTLEALKRLGSQEEELETDANTQLEGLLEDQRSIINSLIATLPTKSKSPGISGTDGATNGDAQFQMGWYKLFSIAEVVAIIVVSGIGFVALRRRRDKTAEHHGAIENDSTQTEPGSKLTAVSPDAPPRNMLKVEALITQGFFIEATASAGPRKSVAEYEDTANFAPEFCEDSTGIVTYGSAYQLWWLSDGTTARDYQPPIGDHSGLSTRMLARDLGDCFVNHLDVFARDAVLAQKKIFHTLESLWQNRLDSYLAALKSANHLDAFKSGCPQNSDGSYVLKWSTTFLGGIVTDCAEHSNLQIFYAGDGGGLVFFRYGDSLSAEIIEPNTQRIFVQAILRDDEAIVRVIVPNNAMQSMAFENIEGFVALSDGAIKTDLGKFLVGLKGAVALRSIEDIRQGLINRTDRSYDDKSMVFGRKVRA